MKQNKTIVIGLTGNSGSGKSEVSKILAIQGAKIIDADKIAHEILLPDGLAYHEVLDMFGKKILMSGGYLDRKKIASIVFNDKEALKKHMDITHKYIKKEMLDRLREYKSQLTEAVVLDAPLLIEANLHRKCNYVWLVAADFDKKINRITARDKLLTEQAKKRIMSQSAQEKLKGYADLIIYNNGGIDELRRTVISEFNNILHKDLI